VVVVAGILLILLAAVVQPTTFKGARETPFKGASCKSTGISYPLLVAGLNTGLRGVLSYPESLQTSPPLALALATAEALCSLLVNIVLSAAALGWLCPFTTWLEPKQLPSLPAAATVPVLPPPPAMCLEKSRANVKSS
jgi:hypothetical protein